MPAEPNPDRILEDLVRRAVQLRMNNINQALNQIRYLQEETQEEGDLRATAFQDLVSEHIQVRLPSGPGAAAVLRSQLVKQELWYIKPMPRKKSNSQTRPTSNHGPEPEDFPRDPRAEKGRDVDLGPGDELPSEELDDLLVSKDGAPGKPEEEALPPIDEIEAAAPELDVLPEESRTSRSSRSRSKSGESWSRKTPWRSSKTRSWRSSCRKTRSACI